MRQKQLSWWQGLGIIAIIWLAGAICDRIWFALDHSVPAWDQADYLNGALNYWHALKNPQWFDADWWRSFWLISNKIPPLHYILTVPFLNVFGTSEDASALIMLFYSAILLLSVYGLGVILFDVSVGLWAAGLCQLLPGLYYYRLEFLLDYPLATIVTLSFYLITLWHIYSQAKVNQIRSWLFALLFGIAFGLSILLKQTALFFLFFPLVWIFISCIKNQQWLKLGQFLIAIATGILICFPWYRTNWLLILTSGKRATLDSAIAEGDPALNTIDAWTYYGEILPYLLSWHLLLIPIGGLILYGIFKGKLYPNQTNNFLSTLSPNFKWRWLTLFLLGGYLLASLNINKDARYILPLLPVLSLVLAVGLLSYQGRWRIYLRWATIILAILLFLANLFPIGGKFITTKLSPNVQHYPYLGQPYPHQEVIQEIIKISPYLRSTLGVLPSTLEINQHNFSFYGGQKNFQVVGRQVGIKDNEIEQDARSLNWFITKTGDQGSVPEPQATITKLIETDSDFQLQKTWQLPDQSNLKLYQRRQPLVTVATSEINQNQVKLERIIVPEVAPPGKPISVTYQWSGNWQELQQGIVLLTWTLAQNNPFQNSFWLHDHSIGMGALDNSNLSIQLQNQTYQVIENTAMLPPPDLELGNYQLKATYLNRQTGKTYPLAVPSFNLTIDPKAPINPAPELDLVTQLRTIAPNMVNGVSGLEPIFTQTARINQYDAKQDYLKQAEIALSYRLQHNKVDQQQKGNWLYTVALSRVLQQDVTGAINSFQQAIQLDSQNPHNYAYLAFVYLYDWQPKLAQKNLDTALKINPNIPELKTLSGIAALMQGNVLKAWHLLQPIINK
ncbi:glycosyl transferase family 39 [Stanieria cyanosphaera PCC 7437]|uniref:Glycosyl transferase family 39 n=1 Tax=Stanieria cyanosphaera (strain ATCC 29371 / PCC 7437) TaxID=111780 RepID=K9XUK0_STAC7|nr:glycosyltransferase family 39 protein [Stanieria cyanosphaera]AFZ35739.1 glycosyl transferase family 39 [Stanieria cyanosphaera PCC 7437]